MASAAAGGAAGGASAAAGGAASAVSAAAGGAGAAPAAPGAGEKAKDFAAQIKLLLLGESGAGKSSLLLRFSENRFSPTFISTIGVDWKSRFLTIDSAKVKVSVWDSAGQERFRALATSFYRSTHGILLVIDLTARRSLESVEYWMQQIKENGDPAISVVLCANKKDMVGKLQVTPAEVQEIAAKHGDIPVFFTSARTGEGVEEVFTQLSSTCYKKVLESKPKRKAGAGVGAAGGAAAGGSDSVQLKDKKEGEGGAAGGKTGCC